MSGRMAPALAIAVVLLGVSASAWSQATVKKLQFRPIASVSGKDVYQAYCVQCHGDDLKGHGPLSVGLRVPPPDLTTIAARNGGEFVAAAVEDSITLWKRVPRAMVDAAAAQRAMETGENTQNAPVMPAFGPIFARLYPQEERDRTIRFANVVAYIKSKQVASTPP